MVNFEIIPTFDILIVQLENIINECNREAATYFLSSHHTEARHILSESERVSVFRQEVVKLRNSWVELSVNPDPEPAKPAAKVDQKNEAEPIEHEKLVVTAHKIPQTITLANQINNRDPKQLNLEHLLRGKSKVVTYLYHILDSKIMNFSPSVRREIYSTHISYFDLSRFCDILIEDNRIALFLNPPVEEMNDPLHICKKAGRIAYPGLGLTVAVIYTYKDLDLKIDLVRQSYSYSIKNS